MNLKQKEQDLLKDLIGQEQLCIDKYGKASAQARDPQLKSLFSDIAGVEQRHKQTLTQIAGGTVPNMGGGAGSADFAGRTFAATYGTADDENKKNDCFLCSDLLATEKHASHLYDTCVFEFCDAGVRSVLNDLQTQEQEHGKAIYEYMATNNMYS